MKKITAVILGTFLTLSVMAKTPVVKQQLKDVKKDKKEFKEERDERNTKLAHGKVKAAKHEQKEIRQDMKHLNATKKDLKRKGVKKPVEKATGKTSIND